MERTDFSAHRVLVVGKKTHSIQLLRSVLGIAGVGKIIHVEEGRRALDLLEMEAFSAVYCDHKVGPVSGMPFLVAARRKDQLLNPMVPIFVLQDRARRRDVEAARDTGVTDVLTMPISPKTLLTKLYAATQVPRPFIVSPDFFGPDRRSKTRSSYFGVERRKRAPRKAKVDFTHV
jgi:two-component system, chemotaxis family, chemotaxis protein CheY